MSLTYTFKRLIRSWQLYIALFLGIVLASTFFAGISVGADTAAKQALDQALNQTPIDMTVYTSNYMSKTGYGIISPKNVTDAIQRINNTQGVAGIEAQSQMFDFSLSVTHNLTRPSRIYGISQTSRVYKGWAGGAPNLEANEAYVWAGSKDISKFQIGTVLPINVTATSFDPNTYNTTTLSFLWNLTVAGFAQLNNEAMSILSGYYQGYTPIVYNPGYSVVYPQSPAVPEENLLITSWEKTYATVLDKIYEFAPAYHNPVSTLILIYLERDKLVYPWDISGSVTRVNTVADKITEKLLTYGLQPTNHLGQILSNFQSTALNMRLLFITVSVPVFFVAWYMGSTVSDVSMNLRRREIGLLLTKGFSKRQILGKFITEALLIGLIGGLAGIGLGILLNPIFVRAAGGVVTGAPFATWDTILLTAAFAVIITFLSTFQSSRRARDIAVVEALRQYRYVEETKPYKRTWPLVALAFGTFKMIILLLGINMLIKMQNAASSGSMLISIFAGLAFIVDSVLTPPVGPWLFAWGLTKILMRGPVKFQELTSRAFKFLGDLGTLATKNVQRNAARSAAVAFLVTLIIAYSFQITGTLASQQDFNARSVLFNVGSDVSVWLGGGRPFEQTPSLNVTSIVNEIQRNLTGAIASITVEYSFSGSISFYGLQLKAVDPISWPTTAYHENEWFSGRDAPTAFGTLRTSNESIILERSYGALFDKKLNDHINVDIGTQTKELRIVGFFGNDPPTSQSYIYPSQGAFPVPSITYWSYVPHGLLRNLGADFQSSEARILIKLTDGVSGKECANKIRALRLSTGAVDSVEEQMELKESNAISTGQLNVLRLGVVFAVIASSIGTALVALVSLAERGREASVMSVRGLSFKQIATILLAENVAVIVFAALLGSFVGLTVVRGTVVSSNASGYLVARRLVFPPDATLALLFSFGLVFASIILPVILMSKRFSSRLERIVRQA